jgi:hypothetical protein
MKATLDIPDDLYRSVKARTALDGNLIRTVAIELFQNWLQSHNQNNTTNQPSPLSNSEAEKYPWLAISRKYVRPSISSDLDDIKKSIERGWATESAGHIGAKIEKS